jgi:hypothetical protein
VHVSQTFKTPRRRRATVRPMSRFMLMARPMLVWTSPSMPSRLPRAQAANQGRGPLAPLPAVAPTAASLRAPAARTALWVWAEPSPSDAP